MKKTLLISAGISAIVILFSIWLYLLVYGTPSKVTEVFTNFGFFNSSAVSPDGEQSLTENTNSVAVVDVAPAKLRQLTTKPVIGFIEFQATSSEPKFIIYAEGGTGHIYSINLTTGEEVRISNTTIPNAEKAVFSSDKKFAAIRSGYGNNSKIILLTLNDSSGALTEQLATSMIDFDFSPENELLYYSYTNTGVSSYALNPSTKISRNQFDVPFQGATVSWSKNSQTPSYVYLQATSKLNGYLYQIVSGKLSRLQIEGRGLTAEGSGNYIFFTTLNGAENASVIYNKTADKFTSSPILMEPNKCAFSSKISSVVYCGYQLTSYGTDFPDEWYMGKRTFNDNIWSVNLDNGSASQLIIPETETGRQLDITSMTNSPDGKVLYFNNKNDNTLWMYEI